MDLGYCGTRVLRFFVCFMSFVIVSNIGIDAVLLRKGTFTVNVICILSRIEKRCVHIMEVWRPVHIPCEP